MITPKILKKFLKLAVEKLHGEWIVIGGTVLPHFRQNIYLFIKLKIERLSSTDLEDCIRMIKHHPQEFELFKEKIIKMIKQKLKIKSPSQGKGKRLQKLFEICSN